MKNIIKNNLKKNAWLTIGLTMLFIMIRPMFQLMSYENAKVYSTPEIVVETMETFFLPDVFTDFLPTLFAGVLVGVILFSYLFSKKKVDLFHSIPVDRKHLFIANYVSGIIIYIIPLIICFIISLGIAIPNHYMTGLVIKNMLIAIASDIVHFLFMYSVTITSVMLSGNIIVALAGAGVFSLFYPIIESLMEYFYSYFFVTYLECNFIKESLLTKFYFLSPVISFSTIIGRTKYYYDDYYYNGNAFFTYAALLMPIVTTAVYVVIAYMLYMNRPSEAAGRALAFKKSQTFIRIPIVILGGFIGAWFMCSTINTYKTSWLFIGMVLGVTLSHCILEIIFNESFKSLFAHKLQFAICILLTAGIFSVFYFDLMGYDKAIPARDDIKSAAVCFEDVDQNISNVIVEENKDETGCFITQYVMNTKAAFTNQYSDKTMIDKIYAISGIGASSVDDMIKRKYESNDNGIIYNEARFYKDAVSEAMAAGTADIDEYSEDGSSVISDDSAYNQAIAWMKENGIKEVDKNGEESNISVDICYTLNSGKIVIKRYDIPISKIYSAMNEVYKTEEFKKDHFDIYNVMEKDAIGKVEVYDVYENRIISLTDNEKNTFLSMYLKDLSKMTADTISQIPVGRMAPYIKINSLYDEALSGYYIYPEFTNTLSYIESLGASTDTFTTKIDKNRIETVSVSSYNLYEYENGESIYVDEIYYSKEKEPEVIDKLADNFEISENIWSNEKLIRYKMGIGDSDTNTMVYLGNDNGIQRSISVLFKDGKMPDRIKKDVAIKIWNDNQF